MSETYEHVPAPGSRLDGAQAAAAAAVGDGQVPAEAIGEVSGETRYVVPIIAELPALGRATLVVLNANNPVLPILPQDPARRSAVLLAVDNDVYLSEAKDRAASVAGTATGTVCAYLPKGIPVPVAAKCAWWVAATTVASNSRVSAIIGLDTD